jgi:hypothetical protein
MPAPDLTVGRTHMWRPARIVAWHRSRPGHVIPAMQQEAAGHMDVALGEPDGDEAGESDAD